MISVIIPAWNEEKYLPNLLSDLKKQTYKDFEIIVADANSTDKTVQMAKRFGCRTVKGGMPGVGRNAGARAAKGDTLLFLDADTRIGSDYLKKAMSEFQSKNLDVSGSKIAPSNNNEIDSLYFSIFNTWTGAMQYVFPHSSGTGMIVKKDLHNKIRGFDESIKLAEDMDYVKRASKKGKFRILSSTCKVAMRRVEKEGRLKFGLKMIGAAAYRIFFGEIRKDIFHYDLRYRK